MKIGILTFHASHNYGSVLQNYALQQFLIAEGHSVETINLRNSKQKYMYHYPLHIGRRSPSLKFLLGRFLDPFWLVKECRRWNIFESFLSNSLVLTRECDNWHAVREVITERQFDAVIVGGDQIWNPFCYDFDWSYFLPDKLYPIKKIAFSPSMGNSLGRIKEDEELVAKIKQYLFDIYPISVREDDARDYLHNLLGRDIPVVADPVFLPGLSTYLNLIGDPIIKEPYIYYYTPSHITDYDAEKKAIELAESLGLRIITSYSHFLRRSPMKCVVSGPAEFLNLVSNAQIVIGKSYHLVLFSLLFHKEFVTVNSGMDSRVRSLINHLNVPERNIESVEDYFKLTHIDYNAVDKEVRKYRDQSILYLRDALS